ncbi:LysR family transcriptional regulator [Kocuria tytonicola]|uniref:LysR family transcriptional regulator n=1 Tax=Kocuria tytonicola TaxID=2055946 RepID=A0A3L9L5X3_9MICC|nr:LysR substrate-binding domain-containing protein [Kocuria tytonicola]RLY94200.1 LysR family transcriptional regulator [Kocuria tytonicola]
MELRQLNCFIAVAEERHFGRAAARLHMAQPQLSEQIRRLEEQLDARLLERTTRRVDLTPAGQELLERGRRIVQETASLAAEVSRLGRATAGVLRAGSCGAATYGTMPRVARGLAAQLPGVTVRLRGELSGPAAETAVREGALDLALLHAPVVSPGLESRTLCREALVVAVPAGAPLATGRPLEVAELAGHEFVAHPPDSVLHRTVGELFRDAGVPWRITQMAHETAELLAHVAAGVGAAVVPASVAALRLPGVVYEELAAPATVDLAVVWRREERSPVVRSALVVVEEILRSE